MSSREVQRGDFYQCRETETTYRVLFQAAFVGEPEIKSCIVYYPVKQPNWYVVSPVEEFLEDCDRVTDVEAIILLVEAEDRARCLL